VNRRFAIVVLVVLTAGASILAYVFHLRLAAVAEFDRQVKLSQADAVPDPLEYRSLLGKESSAGENFMAALEKFGPHQ